MKPLVLSSYKASNITWFQKSKIEIEINKNLIRKKADFIGNGRSRSNDTCCYAHSCK